MKVLSPIVKSHCAKCHGGETTEGEVNLVALRDGELAQNTKLMQRLIEAIEFQEMPPEDELQLKPAARKQLITALKAAMKRAVAKKRRYGHAPIRRMTRFQYNNAVADLLDLNCNVFTLPERMMREYQGYFKPASGKFPRVVRVGSRPLGKSQMIEPRLAGVAAYPQDLRAEHGFDTRGDHLSMSPLLMESFLRLGQSITQSRNFVPKNVGVWHSFFARPPATDDLLPAIRNRLTQFLSRAFRRPVASATLDRYVAFVQRRLDAGGDFTEAMKSVAAATVASPRFLYLYDEPGKSEFAEPISKFDLASRLSFFLWGSIPDRKLFELARAGSLTKPEVLKAQVARMLKDRKLKRFCDSFPSQWLQLDRILSATPNRQKFPGFYFLKYRDSMHMMLEPLLLFEAILIENRPITQLIDSDFTYRTKLLENAYAKLGTPRSSGRPKGGGNVGKLAFTRVPVTDRRNGGIITNAAVMTMTSGPERTKPITRGAWLAAVIFNDPPEPPPANVPPLSESRTESEKQQTLRERLSAHRKRADCKGCHEKIDPLGFALENYNPIGVWRNNYENGRDVDMAGTLMRKHQFKSIIEFKDAILAEKDRFTKALAGHLLSYALGRELTPADHLALQSSAKNTAADGYKIQTLITQVILSEPFLTKTSPRPQGTVR